MEAPLFELVPRAVIWVMFCMVGPGMKSIHQTYQKSGNAQAIAQGFWCCSLNMLALSAAAAAQFGPSRPHIESVCYLPVIRGGARNHDPSVSVVPQSRYRFAERKSAQFLLHRGLVLPLVESETICISGPTGLHIQWVRTRIEGNSDGSEGQIHL